MQTILVKLSLIEVLYIFGSNDLLHLIFRIPNRNQNFHVCFKVIVVLVSSTACQIPTFCKHFTSCTFLCREKFPDSTMFAKKLDHEHYNTSNQSKCFLFAYRLQAKDFQVAQKSLLQALNINIYVCMYFLGTKQLAKGGLTKQECRTRS